MSRLDRLRELLDERLLITNLVNIRYLTGLDSSNAALLVDPDGPATLYTDFRYIQDAEAAPGVEAQMTKRQVLLDLAERLSGRMGFEADVLPYTFYDQLRSGGLELLPTTGLVEQIRAVKDEDEVAAVRRAATAADRAFEALTAETWIGHSERELVWRLQQLMHAHGAERTSFDTFIGSGPNGSKPHGEPGDTIVSENTLVVVDFGALVDRYCSDCTRTMATGNGLPKELRRAYDVCLEAQLAAVDGIRPGMTGHDADAIARDIIEKAGFGDEFGHGLGHGVGVAIHEAPRLARESEDVLAPGQVVTIEPGIYLPGVGGVRIEDLAVVRDGGLELLTHFPKELTLVS